VLHSQNMGDDVGTGTADILRHADSGIGHLGANRFTTQLLDNLNDLIHACGSNRVSAGFESAPGGHGNTPGGQDFAIQG